MYMKKKVREGCSSHGAESCPPLDIDFWTIKLSFLTKSLPIWWRLSDIKVQLEVEKKIIDWNIRTERLNSYIRMKSYG